MGQLWNWVKVILFFGALLLAIDYKCLYSNTWFSVIDKTKWKFNHKLKLFAVFLISVWACWSDISIPLLCLVGIYIICVYFFDFVLFAGSLWSLFTRVQIYQQWRWYEFIPIEKYKALRFEL